MRWLAWMTLLSVMLGGGPVWAEPKREPSDEAAVEAVARGREAKEAFDAGRFEEALDGFSAAEARAHSPVFVLYRARCQRALGRWRDGIATLRVLAAEVVADDAPPQWHAAVARAREELERLEARIPRVTVRLERARGDERIRIDDRPYGGEAVALDPGSHEVVVTRDGEIVARLPFEATEGVQRALVVSLREPPRPPAEPPMPPGPVAPDPPGVTSSGGEPRRASSSLGGYTALGLGGAWLVAGAVAGGLALDRAATARELCGADGICDGDRSERDASERLADASTGMLVLGGLSVVVGIILVTIPLTSSEDVGLGLGPGALRLQGRF